MGITETVNVIDMHENIHNLLHREIIRRDKKTTKLRIVFDTSAKEDGQSLNECLRAGPYLSPLLMDIVL